MVEERYCSFEVSKLLKEKGFDESIHEFYDSPGAILYARNREGFRLSELGGVYYPHITHQRAMDWLREKHSIFIQTNRDNQYHEGYEVTPMIKHDIERGHRPEYYARIFDAKSESNTSERFDDFYDCVEAALKYCLTKLI